MLRNLLFLIILILLNLLPNQVMAGCTRVYIKGITKNDEKCDDEKPFKNNSERKVANDQYISPKKNNLNPEARNETNVFVKESLPRQPVLADKVVSRINSGNINEKKSKKEEYRSDNNVRKSDVVDFKDGGNNIDQTQVSAKQTGDVINTPVTNAVRPEETIVTTSSRSVSSDEGGNKKSVDIVTNDSKFKDEEVARQKREAERNTILESKIGKNNAVNSSTVTSKPKNGSDISKQNKTVTQSTATTSKPMKTSGRSVVRKSVVSN